jgi:hypothetical protein
LAAAFSKTARDPKTKKKKNKYEKWSCSFRSKRSKSYAGKGLLSFECQTSGSKRHLHFKQISPVHYSDGSCIQQMFSEMFPRSPDFLPVIHGGVVMVGVVHGVLPF